MTIENWADLPLRGYNSMPAMQSLPEEYQLDSFAAAASQVPCKACIYLPASWITRFPVSRPQRHKLQYHCRTAVFACSEHAYMSRRQSMLCQTA